MDTTTPIPPKALAERRAELIAESAKEYNRRYEWLKDSDLREAVIVARVEEVDRLAAIVGETPVAEQPAAPEKPARPPWRVTRREVIDLVRDGGVAIADLPRLTNASERSVEAALSHWQAKGALVVEGGVARAVEAGAGEARPIGNPALLEEAAE